mmetsp:Transcript_12087/g.19927  ORF Transcript_12087/g.19927 Transcript_12087/m.19927 type:complete len:380 (+) Transcript_12087:110-1249(+)
MKLHTALMSGAFVTAVAADGKANNNSHLRHLKADSKSSKGTKAGKGSSSYSSSYSMSYGPPTPPVTDPPTPKPTRSTLPPTTPPTPTPSPICCNPADLEELILSNVYNGDIETTFDEDPAKSAMEWLKGDTCSCGKFCTDLQLIQRYILAVLYYSTGGPNWTSCGDAASDATCQVQSAYGNSEGFNWLTCNSECDWGGTDCRNSGVLNVTDVERNGLIGNLPPEIAKLSGLVVLALEQNQLQGPIPSSYGGLDKLAVLDLDFNDLTGSLFDLRNMEKLQQLDLNANSLTGSIEGLGWDLTRLTFIDLSYNKFTGTIAPEIGDLGGLTSLQVQCNEFDPPLQFVKCPSKILAADDVICDNLATFCACTNSTSAAQCDEGP